jgi:hypothetical protein
MPAVGRWRDVMRIGMNKHKYDSAETNSHYGSE